MNSKVVTNDMSPWVPDLSRGIGGSNWLPADWDGSSWGLRTGPESSCRINIPPGLDSKVAVVLEFSEKTFSAPWESLALYLGQTCLPVKISVSGTGARMEGRLAKWESHEGKETPLIIHLPEYLSPGERKGALRLVHFAAGPPEKILNTNGTPEPLDYSKCWVSYAQNFEDVYLQRAFHDINDGFYVDVGANSPVTDSVTLSFYKRGWSGINVEPDPANWKNLAQHRSRDINLNCAVSPTPGSMDFFLNKNSGVSTCLEQMAILSSDPEFYEKISVPARRLEEILETHARTPIHFMKVDVEGFEKEVLESMDFKIHRPWVLVVESTLPGHVTPCHHLWEDGLLSSEYAFVLFDGLNRYYIAREHLRLRWAFLHSPGIFDRFETHEELRLRGENRALKKTCAELTNSISWKVTKPLRSALDLWRGLSSKIKKV